MSRYIDADAWWKAVQSHYTDADCADEDRYELGINVGITKSRNVMMNAPSIDLADYVPKDFHDKTCEAMAKAHQEEIADMVSVVRCKECKRANHELSGIYCGLSDVNMGEDGYCSIGEREGE